jgi:hypothetical protein
LAVQQYPDVGQQVRVRNRTWVVTDMRANALDDRPHRLVDLLSVEDDAHGDTLKVIWDLEPGASVSGRSTLPEVARFDPPNGSMPSSTQSAGARSPRPTSSASSRPSAPASRSRTTSSRR